MKKQRRTRELIIGIILLVIRASVESKTLLDAISPFPPSAVLEWSRKTSYECRVRDSPIVATIPTWDSGNRAQKYRWNRIKCDVAKRKSRWRGKSHLSKHVDIDPSQAHSPANHPLPRHQCVKVKTCRIGAAKVARRWSLHFAPRGSAQT